MLVPHAADHDSDPARCDAANGGIRQRRRTFRPGPGDHRRSVEGDVASERDSGTLRPVPTVTEVTMAEIDRLARVFGISRLHTMELAGFISPRPSGSPCASSVM